MAQRSVTMDGMQNQRLKAGLLAFLGSGASMAACYVVTVTEALSPVLGNAVVSLNPHFQAVLMWGFALVAVVGIAIDRKHHRQTVPLAVAILAFAILMGTLYAYYDPRLEILGYVTLVIAAFLNQNAILTELSAMVQKQTAALSEVNATLAERVNMQVQEIDRLARLKRFLAPQVADIITNEARDSLLNSHRGFITCLFCDIRNFTQLSDEIEPEEVLELLQDYHQELGHLINKHDGTIGFRSGDGLMVILNDPIPVDHATAEAASLACDMQAAFRRSRVRWQKLGYQIGFGIGMASGYATLGLIGDERRKDYTAIGNVVNLAARLCDRADDGEILVNRRIYADLDGEHSFQTLGPLELKGFDKPVEAFQLIPPTHADNVISAGFGDAAKS